MIVANNSPAANALAPSDDRDELGIYELKI